MLESGLLLTRRTQALRAGMEEVPHAATTTAPSRQVCGGRSHLDVDDAQLHRHRPRGRCTGSMAIGRAATERLD
jgi:hypothetical protein